MSSNKEQDLQGLRSVTTYQRPALICGLSCTQKFYFAAACLI